jgi:dynein heavy chain 1
MLRRLITETYGGKIDDEDDFALLSGIVSSVFTVSAFEVGHKIVAGIAGSGGDDLIMPSGTSMAEFMGWIGRLPEREPPTYLGLPANAEKLLLVELATNVISNVARVAEVLDEAQQMVGE